MADTKISALPASTTPLAGTEVLPIVQSSTTRQVSVANLTAGRAISATQLTLTTGNLIVASGQGIDFSATPGTGTSELLADYEEGTWTPNQGSGLTVVGTFSSSGTYTKIGRQVTVFGTLSATSTLTFTAGGLITSNLPFSAGATGRGTGLTIRNDYSQSVAIYIVSSGIYGIGEMGLTPNVFFSATYSV